MTKSRPDNLQKISNFYNARINQGFEDHQICGWGSKETQLLRFEMLFQNLDASNKVIVDLGCGLGEMCSWLMGNFENVRYIGIDISTELLDEARRRFSGNTNVTFLDGDIFQASGAISDESPDFVVASGTFSFKHSGQDTSSYTYAAVRRMWELANQAVMTNFLSTSADYQLEKNIHYEPEELVEVARDCTRFFCINQGYSLYEFTLQMRKRPSNSK